MTTLLKILLLTFIFINLSFSSEYDLGFDQFSEDQRAKVLDIRGTVTAQDIQGNLRKLELGDYLFESEFVTTSKDAYLLLNFQANGSIAMDPDASVYLGPVTKNNLQHIHLLNGRLSYFKNPQLENRIPGLFFSLPYQTELFSGEKLELKAQGKQSRVFVQKGQLTRINLAPKTDE